MPESSIEGEKRVSLIFLKLPLMKRKAMVSVIKPIKLRPNDMKSPGALM